MTIAEAKQIGEAFYRKSNPTQDDIFLFTEAMHFLIDTTHDPAFMMDLGGYYYGERNYRLALKYYEMAAEYDNPDAWAGLGYIYYYGRVGEPDYEKAFHYYQKAAEAGDLQCAYKLADMYRNGYFVKKDLVAYKKIIEELYPKIKNAHYVNEPLPEIFSRLAKIRAEEGRTEEALRLYFQARDFIAQRIRYNPFFGNRTIMKGIIKDIYRLQHFDRYDFSLYDLYYLLESPVKVTFRCDETTHMVEAVQEDGECVIRFDDRWYRTVDDFFEQASIENELLTSLYSCLYLFEVVNE